MIQQQTNIINKVSMSEGEKVSDIQSLTLRAQDLARSVDVWNTAMIWVLVLAAIAAIAVVLVTRIVLTRSRQLADVQEQLIRVKDKQLALDLRDKDLKISEVSEKAATAEAKAEGFRLDIAKANERAAEANRVAEQERLARLKLEARLADRTLTPTQQTAIRSQLAIVSGIAMDVVIWGDTPEIQIISRLILDSIPRPGWSVQTAQAVGGGAVRGILVGTREGSDANVVRASTLLISALRSAGLVCGPWPFEQLRFPSAMLNTTVTKHAPIRMFIGAK